MIDHTGHPHPSTPKARALCRANGGTGFIGKLGAAAPVAKKSDNGKTPSVPKPHTVNVKPPEPKKPSTRAKKTDAVARTAAVPKPATVHQKTPAHTTTAGHKPPDFPAPKPIPATTTTNTGAVSSITPGKFDKAKMEIKDGNGNWRKVALFTKGGQYTFRDADGKVIRTASAREKIDVRTVEIPRVSVPPRNIGATMALYIPEGNSANTPNDEVRKIQNALRAGASREYIIGHSKMPDSTASREIDRILKQYRVPNHVYPRREGTSKPPGSVPNVTTASVPKIGLEALKASGRVEPKKKDGPKSRALTVVESRIQLSDSDPGKAKAQRVAAIQEDHVGDRIMRIQSVKRGIPDGTNDVRYQNVQTANAACLNGHIHLHQHFDDSKAGIEGRARTTGYKVRGGDDPIETTIAHEMGHALMTNWDLSADQRKTIANALVQHLDLEQPPGWESAGWSYNKFEALVKHNRDKIKRRVSDYATTNSNELIAEVWADYTMNPRPATHIRGIGDAIKAVALSLPSNRKGK